ALPENLQETEEYFAELQDCGHYDEDQRSCISFPAHELAYLHSVGDCAPCLLIAGTSDGAKLRALECILGERVLPDLPSDADNAGGGTADGVGNGNGGGGGDGGGSTGAACRATRLRHGTERRASLVLPGQFELLHPQQATPPPSCQDPAFRQAQLELSLPHPLLKEARRTNTEGLPKPVAIPHDRTMREPGGRVHASGFHGSTSPAGVAPSLGSRSA
ncbi:dual serine/threonine and tyrosine protein kinase-like, partial [Lethenteron reissneri]|uniref:dual serine/threonine and tyrosine protein kinase-like n=1 Tax=Lethenteron reissneri TaxID=7753 RepID=UPI002AB78800